MIKKIIKINRYKRLYTYAHRDRRTQAETYINILGNANTRTHKETHTHTHTHTLTHTHTH